MVMAKLLTIREVAQILSITEKEVIELSEKGVIPAYKVGGVYLRFRKDQLDQIRDRIKPDQSLVSIEGTVLEASRDFVYRNDFYILSLVVIFCLLYFIVRL
jgi:excisionase family DNA binding protein